ncbi:MAG: T9SS type A sorting domain-containing protein [Chitinophagaceae bacterium]|nr:T9SS type A sorting domain-containing protein [Chitinophagaceae bacterium]
MKKILIPLIALAISGIVPKVQSQCVVTNLGVNLKSFNTSTCRVIFDLSWEQEVNNGNKYAYIHLWTGVNYHTPVANWVNMYSNPAAYPKATDLVNSLGTISIFDNGTATPLIGNTYPPDELAVFPITTGISVIKTPLPGGIRERMTILNIEFVLSSCENVVSVKGDVWASQASNGKNVHCASQGLSFNLNNPRVAGFKICEPRSVTFGITNNDPATAITVYYNLYKDDGDEIFEPGAGSGLDGTPILTSSSINILPLAAYTESKMTYPGSNAAGETGSLWVEVITTVPAFSFVAIGKLQDPGCVPLPAEVLHFNVIKERGGVVLKWTTATEYQNAGFGIERNVGNGWNEVVFISSLGINGNSDRELNYQYIDQYNTKGATQYRLRQVDIDGNKKFSEIRTVYGEGQAGAMIVYPNPSNNGKVNIVFNGYEARRDISIVDMDGRCIRMLRGIVDNSIILNDLPQGIFVIRALNIETREQTTQKVVINR